MLLYWELEFKELKGNSLKVFQFVKFKETANFLWNIQLELRLTGQKRVTLWMQFSSIGVMYNNRLYEVFGYSYDNLYCNFNLPRKIRVKK